MSKNLSEYPLLRKDQILFTYLHLAPAEELTHAIIKSGVVAIAFETIELPDGSLPCLQPMSEIAGRIATLVGAQYIGGMHKGLGKLLGGVPGVPPATVVVLGGGVVGTHAAQMALGLGARVIMVTRNLNRLRYLEEVMHGRFETLASNPYNIANIVKEADVLVGGVLVAGGRAPTMVTREMVKTMKPGSVIVDVAVDQGVGGVLRPPTPPRMINLSISLMMLFTTQLPTCRECTLGLLRWLYPMPPYPTL